MKYNKFKDLARGYNAIPVYRTMMDDIQTPVSLFLKLREGGRYPFLLESVEGGENVARYSFLGRNPYQILRNRNGELVLEKDSGIFQLTGSYFENIRSLIGKYREPVIPDLPRLTGGAVGYSSYDTIRMIEELPDMPEDDLELPESIWAFYDEIYAFDHVKHRIILIKTIFIDDADDVKLKERYEYAQQSLDSMQEVMNKSVSYNTPFHLSGNGISSNTGRKQYQDMVEKARDYIYEGDIFQVVLSQRFTTQFEGDRFMLYRALRTVNPSPYLFYLDFGKFALIGSSPEVLVRVQDGIAEVLPIAGTRPRGKTTEEDLALEVDLKNDPKELSEHVMLVDLGRNDLSRICKPGSVSIKRNMGVERYSHVMHIVSDVTGNLSDNCDAVDALKHCFPAGTVSGAPKVRAMEIIDELEVNKRGPYAGAIGYFDFSGNMDTCIAIRTMIATDKNIYIQAGAGIVADSNPAKEYEETQNKARALVEALNVALNNNDK